MATYPVPNKKIWKTVCAALAVAERRLRLLLAKIQQREECGHVSAGRGRYRLAWREHARGGESEFGEHQAPVLASRVVAADRRSGRNHSGADLSPARYCCCCARLH